MPSKEAGQSQHKEKPRRPSYLEARQYMDANEAAPAYIQSQEAIRRDTRRANLSVYRLMVGPSFEPHVVVLGDTPNHELLEELAKTLGSGEHVELEPEVVEHLMERRAEAERMGSWVERHYLPGKPVRLPRRRK